MQHLSTADVAARLGVAQVTVSVWCQQGRFPHARQEKTIRGPVWLIPESDLQDFQPPKRGRIPKNPADTTRELNSAFKQATKRRNRKAAGDE